MSGLSPRTVDQWANKNISLQGSESYIAPLRNRSMLENRLKEEEGTVA
jgi:hypothetical protein